MSVMSARVGPLLRRRSPRSRGERSTQLLPLSLRGFHLYDEPPDTIREFGFALSEECFARKLPSALNLVAGCSKASLVAIATDAATEQLRRGRLGARSGVRGVSALGRTVDGIALVRPSLATDSAFGGVGGDALFA
jgi:hypothetical protein